MSDAKDFTFTGRATVHKVEKKQTKSGSNVVTLVVAFEGRRPELIPVTCFSRLADAVSGYEYGTPVVVSCRVGGHEYNGKVYADIVAENVEATGDAPAKAPASSDDSTPF